MNLVVHHVTELQDVGLADGDGLAELLAGAAVVQPRLAGARQLGHQLVAGHVAVLRMVHVDEVAVRLLDGVRDLFLGGAVEHGRGHVHRALHDLVGFLGVRPAPLGGPAEVVLEQLADVHTGRNAQGVQDDVDRGAVGEVGHVLDRQHAGDNALVAVTAGQLVALLHLALLSDVDAHELVHAGGQIIAGLAGGAVDADDAAAGAVGHLQRRIAHLAGLLAEDGAKQALLGGELGLALRGDLAHQHVSREHLGAHADDAVGVQIGNHVLGDVGDLAGDLLGAQLRVAGVHLVLGDVDGG